MKNKSWWQKLYHFGVISVITVLITIFTSSYDRYLADSNTVKWDYRGELNAYNWGTLAPEFESCSLGEQQSPININSISPSSDVTPRRRKTQGNAHQDSDRPEELAELKFNYQPSNVEVVNNGHTIQVNYPPGSTLNLNDQQYELLQFHFHTPSEHKINDQAAAMEVHFVHKNAAGKLAVVGVMINSGVENPLIAQVWQAIPEGNKANKTNSLTFNAADLLPSDKTYLSYEGSLTTPPCSEGVSWNLLLEPIEVSPEQVATFENIFHNNARPIQALNGRSVNLHRDGAVVE